MRALRSSALVAALWAVACGASSAKKTAASPAPPVAVKAAQPAAPASSGAGVDSDSAPHALPTQCAAGGGSLCVPNPTFVDRLCADSYPDVALYMFSKAQPWTHAYLNRNTKAWNASGGASEAAELKFDEEVLVLRKRGAPSGGIQVSGANGSYDVLRWDGSCATLETNELTMKRPPSPKAAHVYYRYLDTPVQDSLRTDSSVDKAYRERRKQCKGATMGEVSLKCVHADTGLSEAIVDFVRGGGAVAKPSKVP
jgi:hypothetical protein